MCVFLFILKSTATPPFYCNICRKDISSEPRVKCLSCKNFDLCLDCFRVGSEIFPHEATHPYIVIEKLDFPLFKKDWLAIEEVLLLDAIATFGLGNWEAAVCVPSLTQKPSLHFHICLFVCLFVGSKSWIKDRR